MIRSPGRVLSVIRSPGRVGSTHRTQCPHFHATGDYCTVYLYFRAPSKPLWCDLAAFSRADRPRIIPTHDTRAHHAGDSGTCLTRGARFSTQLDSQHYRYRCSLLKSYGGSE